MQEAQGDGGGQDSSVGGDNAGREGVKTPQNNSPTSVHRPIAGTVEWRKISKVDIIGTKNVTVLHKCPLYRDCSLKTFTKIHVRFTDSDRILVCLSYDYITAVYLFRH